MRTRLESLLLSAFLAGTADCFSPTSSDVRVGRIVNCPHGQTRVATDVRSGTHDRGRKPSRKRPRAQETDAGIDDAKHCESMTPDPYLPQRLQEMVDHLHRQPDLCARSKLLVALGDSFAQTDSAILRPGDDPQRIPGCVSEVYISVGLSHPKGRLDPVVSIRGTSDARVSRGILALLAKGLEGESADTVLGLRRETVASAVGLRVGLAESRINGLGNALKVIQDRVQHLLDSAGAVEPSTVAHDQEVVAAGDETQSGPPSPSDEGGVAENMLKWSPLPGTEDEVAVLLSGGVDSSVALRLLQDQGHRVRAFYLKIWLEDELAHLGKCPWEEDLAFATAVCEQAGVPLEVVPLQQEYWEQVVTYTVQEAREGRTPNPDIMCNSRIKFGMFYDHVGKYFRYVATGHYARLEREPESPACRRGDGAVVGTGAGHEGGERVRLFTSPDAVKDQTYFLCTLTQPQLRKALFPVGGYTKDRIRQLAEDYDLPTKRRKDSQGICFLGKLKFDDFLRHYLGESPGLVVDRETGETLGEHRGLWFHTIGQRKGIGPILRPGNVHRGPWYVSGKDIPANKLEVEALRWIAGQAPSELRSNGLMKLQVKTRHGPEMKDCVVRLGTDTQLPLAIRREGTPESLAGSDERNPGQSVAKAHVRLARKDSGLAPGQFAAFYLGEECLGAGVISDSGLGGVSGAEGVVVSRASRSICGPKSSDGPVLPAGGAIAT